MSRTLSYRTLCSPLGMRTHKTRGQGTRRESNKGRTHQPVRLVVRKATPRGQDRKDHSLKTRLREEALPGRYRREDRSLPSTVLVKDSKSQLGAATAVMEPGYVWNPT